MSLSRLPASFQLPIYSETMADFFALLRQKLNSDVKKTKTLLVFTPNPEQLVQAEKDNVFLKDLSQGDILLSDGNGLLVANRILRFCGQLKGKKRSVLPAKIKERIAGVDVVDKLLIEAAKYNYKSLIIGGRDYAQFWGKSGGEYSGELHEDKKSLIELKKNLYWTEAYQDKDEILPVEDKALEKILSEIKPQLVFVALGAPDQEQWLVKWRSVLEKNGVVVGMAVGGSFDFLFDKVKRAPKIMRTLGLEWFWRLLQQPWRWRRQYRLIQFISLTVKAAKDI